MPRVKNIKLIWQHRQLLYFLLLRDIKVRYKQTLVGFSWVLLQPLLSVIIFTFLFSQLGFTGSARTPYPIFVLAGLMFWNLFSRSVVSASESVIANQNLVKTVSFPKIILPLASIGVHLVDFIFTALLLIIMVAIFGSQFYFRGLLLLPVILLISLLASIGLGSFFAALNVRYRDIRLLLPFLFQLLFFLTPVVYSLDVINQRFRVILLLNPMAGAIEFFKASLLLNKLPAFNYLAVSSLLSLIAFLVGVGWFQRSQQEFVDIV